jgi:hypothetical protein
MTTRAYPERVALTLGAVSVASALLALLRGDFDFVRLRGWGVVVAVGLGAVALAAGWSGWRALTMAAGTGFVVAAVAQVVTWTMSDNLFAGNGSTVSWWLGLGIGLLTAGLAPRIWPEQGPDPARTTSRRVNR